MVTHSDTGALTGEKIAPHRKKPHSRQGRAVGSVGVSALYIEEVIHPATPCCRAQMLWHLQGGFDGSSTLALRKPEAMRLMPTHLMVAAVSSRAHRLAPGDARRVTVDPGPPAGRRTTRVSPVKDSLPCR